MSLTSILLICVALVATLLFLSIFARRDFREWSMRRKNANARWANTEASVEAGPRPKHTGLKPL